VGRTGPLLIQRSHCKQCRRAVKSHKVVIFRLFGDKIPTVPIETEICIADNLTDIITCAKFQDEIFRGYDFTGVEFPIFLLIFARALQQQRYCAACDFVQK